MSSSLRLWHSGMLLILIFVLSSTVFGILLPPTNFKIQMLEKNNNSVTFKCDSSNNQDDSSVLKYQWKWNGEILNDETSDAISVENIDFTENSVDENENNDQEQQHRQNYRIECFASNHAGISWAFLDWDHILKIWRNSNQSLSLEFDPDAKLLKCQCNSCQSTSVNWFKNAKLIPNQQAVMNQLQLEDIFEINGTYGCLVDNKTYLEQRITIDYQPKITTNLQKATLGSQVILTCMVQSTNPTALSLTWYFNEFETACVLFSNCTITETNLPNELNSHLSLTVSRETEGLYKCVASEKNPDPGKNDMLDIEATNQFELKIYEDIPVIFDISVLNGEKIHDKILVLEGTELYLNCLHNGSNIKWILPDQSQSSVNPLVIPDVDSENDQGIYECTTSNSLGIITKYSVDIVIIRPIRIKESDDSPMKIELKKPLKLSCDTMIDPQILDTISIQWFKDEQNLNLNNESEIFIESVDKTDGGTYQCQVKSSLDFLDSVKSTWSVEISQIPKITPTFPHQLVLLNGQTKEIHCIASGIPVPKVDWTYEQNIIDTYPRKVLTDFVTSGYDDNFEKDMVIVDKPGIFICEASNSHGNSTLAVEAIFVNSTQFSSNNSVNNTVIKANAGTSIQINCSAIYDQQLLQFGITRHWYKNGAKLDSESGEFLSIPYLRDLDHEGNYICELTTQIEHLTLVQTLDVITEKPKLMKPVENMNSSFLKPAGSNITFQCIIQAGIPKPQALEWKFQSKILDSKNDSMLTLSNLSAENEGSYQCMAVNEYGSDAIEYQLEVVNLPKFKQGPEDLLMKTFGLVQLPCKLTIDDRLINSTSVQWFYNDTLIPNPEILDDHLILDKVTKEDEGSYTCLVTSPIGSVNMTAKLSVLAEPPAFTSTETNITKLDGSTVLLACQANGMPLPKIRWTKNGKNVTSNDKIEQKPLGDLQINSLGLEDEGIYVCEAYNIYGTIQTEVNVEVIKKSDQGDSTRDVIKNMNDNATLNCSIYIDPRVSGDTKVHWYKESTEITPLDLTSDRYFKLSNNSLSIKSLVVEDEGNYICTVETPYESLNSTVKLAVLGEPPKILSDLQATVLYEGENLTILCQVRGVPLPSLVWYFNDSPISGRPSVKSITTGNEKLRESQIEIAQVTKKDEGIYKCEASNTYGSGVTRMAKVTVVERTTVKTSRSIRVDAGQHLKIPCKFQIDPHPSNKIIKFEWAKVITINDTITEEAIDQKNPKFDWGMDGIHIAKSQRSDSGIYRCTVTTKLEPDGKVITASANADVTIVVNAPQITDHSPNQIVFAGNDVFLYCKAQGIPKPEIFWSEPKYVSNSASKLQGNDFVIRNAILSDNGQYNCTAINSVGNTTKAINIKVIHMATLIHEYLVEPNGNLTLPCFDYDQTLPRIPQVSWSRNGVPVPHSSILSNGSLHIKRMTEDEIGEYICQATLSTNQRAFVNTKISLRPEIILSRGEIRTLEEGENVYLECAFVKGIHGTRVWKRDNKIFYEFGSDRISYQNHGGLLEIKNARPSDSGNYSCEATTTLKQGNSEKDVIQYQLKITPLRTHWTPGSPYVSCHQVKDQPVQELLIFKKSNDSVEINWSLPSGLNHSCYEHIAFIWWTDNETSSFNEMKIPNLDQKSVQLKGLEPDLKYYIQIDLIAPQNIQMYSTTKSFNLTHGPFDTPKEISQDLITEQAGTNPLIIVVISVITLVITIILVLALVKWRQRWSKPNYRFARNSVHRRHQSGLECCHQWCYKPTAEDLKFQKTNFNGFDTGMYEAAIITAPTDSVTSGHRRPAMATKRTSTFTNSDNKKNNEKGGGDFMSNLTPQWPEPEVWPEPEEAPVEQQETFPFIRTHNSTFDPGNHDHRRRDSKESISSSWSSLFNVPGTSSAGTMRPNSVAVSNLSSSGSGADYAAKVAFIGKKYRKT